MARLEDDGLSVANHHEERERLTLCPHIVGHVLSEHPIAMFRHRSDAESYVAMHDDGGFYLDSPGDKG